MENDVPATPQAAPKQLFESATAEPAPFTPAELGAAMRHPGIAIDVLLAQRERWTASVVENRHLAQMAGLLLVSTFLFSLPYGLVLSYRQAWQIALLFLGSVAICLPSLHVVTAYLGLRIHVAQSFAFATIIAAVAAIFSFGFAPILWFLHATIDGPLSRATVKVLSGFLLALCALLGSAHGMRCLKLTKRGDESFTLGFVVLVWQLLLLFIGVRMSGALGLI